MVFARFLLMLAVILFSSSAATYILYKFIHNNRLVKYLPALLSFFLVIYNFYLAKTLTTDFEDIARTILAIIFLASFLGGLLTGLFIDFILPKIKKPSRS